MKLDNTMVVWWVRFSRRHFRLGTRFSKIQVLMIVIGTYVKTYLCKTLFRISDIVVQHKISKPCSRYFVYIHYFCKRFVNRLVNLSDETDYDNITGFKVPN